VKLPKSARSCCRAAPYISDIVGLYSVEHVDKAQTPASYQLIAALLARHKAHRRVDRDKV
jgi:hypothetical protein